MAVEPSAGLSAASPSAASVYLSEVEEMLRALALFSPVN